MSYQPPTPETDSSAVEPKRGAKGRQRAGKHSKPQRDVSKMLAMAQEKYDAGRVKGAIDLLKRVLSADRENAVATALLSLCYMRQRRIAEGDKLMMRALQMAPMNTGVLSIYAKLLHGLGQLDQAANTYGRALQLEPQNADLYRDLAILLIDARLLDQATEALIMAVRFNPRDAKAFYHLGLIKKMQGRDGEAIDAYSMAVAIKPDYPEAHINLGKIAIDHQKYELGEKSCLKAIEANPDLAQPYINLCMLKRAQKQFDEAARYGRRAVELEPMSGAAHSNLGAAYLDMHRYQEALASFRKAMEFQPSFAASYFNCGNALRLMHDLDKANVYYKKSQAIEPDRAEFIHNQGLVYQEQGRNAEALACFRESTSRAPGNLNMRFSLARSLWRNEKFEESWDYFDAGLDANLRRPNRKFAKPRWQGEDIADKRILVWREQGIGDEIDFSRRYPQIIDVAGETIIEAGSRLVSIFQRSFPQARILPEVLNAKADQERDDCDLHLPAGNLLQYFPFSAEELALKQYPEDDIEAAFACGERSKGANGYLAPDPGRVAEMASRVAELPDGLKLGICWRSQLTHRDRDIHYTRLAMWEPIFRVPGLVFVNLFYDRCEDEIVEVEERFGIKIHRWDDIDLKNDMEAAFALTTQVDLVLSTASSPSRIAEAVGKEVWLMTAGAGGPQEPPSGEYGLPHQLRWKRHWKEPWSVLMARIARALEARLEG